MSASPKTIYLKDYQPPEYLIKSVDLHFDLHAEFCTVTARSQFKKNPASHHNTKTLSLAGQDLELKSLVLNDKVLLANEYQINDEKLTIPNVPDSFTLVVVTRIQPQLNTALEGLYQSSGMYCTQCEAEGFRHITWFLDQPDVMAVYTTTIEADQADYPVLLSNGNKVDSGTKTAGRHWVKWHDPFPKPSYLFALVAGNLESKEDKFITQSGREVRLQIFVEAVNADKCDHALASLKKSMRWDEEVYGREYDLDIFMIVAVNDFNMGAMENKGLNIFNSACVLAKPETATDADFENIEGIIGHEYFHNWSGNRVTCRDWFQLSLKEGFTVFRDQEFSADMSSRAVKRISDVNILRTAQFPQDAGPMAHPIRPASFIDINNFYTVTVYNKGAEVVRMIHHLLGTEKFRQGTDLYFERHDGEAVTTDDFVKAMEEASGVDLSQFRRWYSQAGTPELYVTDEFDSSNNTYTLTVKQSCPATPEQVSKQPFHIPFAVGLLNDKGEACRLSLQSSNMPANENMLLDIKKTESSFVFEGIYKKPTPSLLRGFSAPVKIFYDYSKDDLRFLMSHDKDAFNRWDAGQRLATIILKELIEDINIPHPLDVDVSFLEAMGHVLQDQTAEKSLITQALSVPNEILISELYTPFNPDAIHEAREFLCHSIAKAMEPALTEIYHQNNRCKDYQFNAEQIGQRALKNQCLAYLVRLNTEDVRQLALDQYQSANNMTDLLAALSSLVNIECDERQTVLQDFYKKWAHDPLVVDKWFSIQARAVIGDALPTIKSLLQHDAFDIKNPNKVRAVIGSVCFANPVVFHQADGETYNFVAEQIIVLNDLNPQIAARLANAFNTWKRVDDSRQIEIENALQKILAHSTISKDVFEVVNKTLIN
ncbi:Membrane alanine aminopeptidase N [hydrothermal vent metagenome]|uniref:Membrane alanine aminopeptidase N n=1 Tax=hydrothermal vent metagenome TaxID=652676 RepID=A0A3B0ZMN1_9ZZZZ